MRGLSVIALIGLFAGCCSGKSDQDPKAGAGAASAEMATASSATEMAAASGASVHLDPSVLDECDLKSGAGQVVEVSWDATAAKVTSVKVLVQGPRDNEKVWTSGGVTGKDKTGPWVYPGTTFTVTSGENKPLARVTIQSKACAK